MGEERLEEVSNELGIEMATEPNYSIEGSRDEKFSNILKAKVIDIRRGSLINLELSKNFTIKASNS